MNNSFEVGIKPNPKKSEFICDFCKSLKISHHYPCEKCYNKLFNVQSCKIKIDNKKKC